MYSKKSSTFASMAQSMTDLPSCGEPSESSFSRSYGAIQLPTAGREALPGVRLAWMNDNASDGE